MTERRFSLGAIPGPRVLRNAAVGLFAAAFLTTAGPLFAADANPDHDAKMKWFREAKFGMFIHWGIYSVPAGEWDGKTNYAEWFQLQTKMPNAQYEKFAAQFDPVKFNARQWVRVAKDAGMKYLVITSKHHDGFSMYNTAFSDYNVVKATPWHHDPMKDLAAACKEAGIKFCFYYSIADWHYPDVPAQYNQRGFHGAPNPDADVLKYADYMRHQVHELLTGYGPIGIIWFDGGGAFRSVNRKTLLKADAMVDMIHQTQPACLINNRLGAGADYGTPEQKIPTGKQKEDFEVCMTLNNHWGYNKHDQHWKSATTIIRNLADIAHKGGNYLLNVGPTAEGLFPPPSVEILGAVGQWMKVNGDSIYGTTASPWPEIPNWGRITAKGNRLYLHVFERPEDGVIRLAGLKTLPRGAQFLAYRGGGAPPTCRLDGSDLLVQLPATLPEAADSAIELRFAKAPEITAEKSNQNTAH